MHANYMVMRKEYRDMIPMKAMYAMDFVAIINEDGSYEILKNRFDDQTRLENHIDFLAFYSMNLI